MRAPIRGTKTLTDRPGFNQQPGATFPLWYTAVCVVLVALNLRLPITAVSPVLDQIQQQSRFSSTVASLLVAMPVACFVVFSTAAARAGRRRNLAAVIGASLVIMLIGFAVRSLPSEVTLFAGTAVLGLAITVGNVLLPTLIKQDRPHHSGLLTGLYSMALYLGAAIGAGLTVPLQQATGLGWQSVITLWAILPALTLLAWLPRFRTHSSDHTFDNGRQGGSEQVSSTRRLWADPTAWAVTVCWAMPTLLFYALSAWLPTILLTTGMSPLQAGAMLSLVNIAAVPTALAMGILVNRTRQQVWATTATSALLGAGMLGFLAVRAEATILWMVLLGIGLGGGTAIGYALPLLRSPDVSTTAKLTAMSQTAGFLLCALGPVAVGALHDLTRSWTPALMVLAALTMLQALAGIQAGRKRFVHYR